MPKNVLCERGEFVPVADGPTRTVLWCFLADAFVFGGAGRKCTWQGGTHVSLKFAPLSQVVGCRAS
jgi:hypothetical protein